MLTRFVAIDTGTSSSPHLWQSERSCHENRCTFVRIPVRNRKVAWCQSHCVVLPTTGYEIHEKVVAPTGPVVSVHLKSHFSSRHRNRSTRRIVTELGSHNTCLNGQSVLLHRYISGPHSSTALRFSSPQAYPPPKKGSKQNSTRPEEIGLSCCHHLTHRSAVYPVYSVLHVSSLSCPHELSQTRHRQPTINWKIESMRNYHRRANDPRLLCSNTQGPGREGTSPKQAAPASKTKSLTRNID